ncbi:hypothetical protein H6F43_20020 [Leptolyngbya sp. FACHB-36]|uniref:hypothetical protein n=1 Tax=Leptolyngbya sp. FACHB-36 TaxID=2692808 RepID=UPI00167FF15D|nr:hypothetical protein [Leptolyngbya sp. FACHB-36]MBD2022470.1 hypothetical protein [Leptolyngbya sp. FACHB-36]
MTSITVRSHVGTDGVLTVQLPVELSDTEVEVTVTVTPTPPASATTPDDRGWSPGFFERTSGCLADDPIARPSQGEFDQRDWDGLNDLPAGH